MSKAGVESRVGIIQTFSGLIPGIILCVGIGISLVTEVGRSVVPGSLSIVTDLVNVVSIALLVIISLPIGIMIESFGRKLEHILDPEANRKDISIGGRGISNPFARISMRREIENLIENRSTHFEEEFGRLCEEEFDSYDGAIEGSDAKQLWRFIRSYLLASPYSLGIRYYALNRMFRGLWSCFVILFFYYLLIIILVLLVGDSVKSINLLLAFAGTSGIFVFLFGNLKNAYKRRWFDTLILEYYLAKTEQTSD